MSRRKPWTSSEPCLEQTLPAHLPAVVELVLAACSDLQPNSNRDIRTRLFLTRHSIAAHVAAMLQILVKLRVDPTAAEGNKLEPHIFAWLHDWGTQVHLGTHTGEPAAAALVAAGLAAAVRNG